MAKNRTNRKYKNRYARQKAFDDLINHISIFDTMKHRNIVEDMDSDFAYDIFDNTDDLEQYKDH